MTFVQSVQTCLRSYVRFSGRAGRPEYWYFLLFVLLGNLVAGAVDAAIFGPPEEEGASGPLASLFSLATFLPLLAAGWRRMHDTGRSGLYLLYPLIAVVGLISFVSFSFGLAPLAEGDFSGLFGGAFGVIVGLSVIVVFLSPLIVLFWLSRPGQPGANIYGPPVRKN